MKKNRLILILVVAFLALAAMALAATDYVVVVSKETNKDAEWGKVVKALLKKHDAKRVTFEKDPAEALKRLQRMHPRYTCFVAQPKEATRLFSRQVHKLTRQYDEDIYPDTVWGILTGFDAANALEIASHAEPLVVRKVASGTDVQLEMCEEGVWYCELNKNRMVRKKKGGEPEQIQGPDDTTQLLADALNKYKADLFVTSGHATERNWQIGYRYRNGYFRSKAGDLFGTDSANKRIEIKSPNPKVYLPIGNCLMGNIDGPDAMALAWMNDAGVRQMMGYTVPSWYGYAGWGCLDYFVEQPGRYTFAEAYHANQRALQHRLATGFPKTVAMDVEPGKRAQVSETVSTAGAALGLKSSDATGLLFDREVTTFYGDPKWEAKMAEGTLRWKQTLEEKDGVYTFTVTPLAGEKSFDTVNANGSQRGGRPLIQFFKSRLKNIKLIEGADFAPVIADDFLLVPKPATGDPNRPYRVRFTAEAVE